VEQKWPSQLVIVRHGESERNVSKEVAKKRGAHSYGSGLRDMDTPLTKAGRRQAISTGEYLAKKYTFDTIFSSPYLRTLQTAEDREFRRKQVERIGTGLELSFVAMSPWAAPHRLRQAITRVF
jgi:broad specificity phosphatase PhoE